MPRFKDRNLVVIKQNLPQSQPSHILAFPSRTVQIRIRIVVAVVVAITIAFKLAFFVVFGFLALVARDTIADPRDNPVQAVVTGLAHHSQALVVGYALCLGWLAWRLRSDTEGSLDELVS